jgi:hypothetical protein
MGCDSSDSSENVGDARAYVNRLGSLAPKGSDMTRYITRSVRIIDKDETRVFKIEVDAKIPIHHSKRQADEVRLALGNIINRLHETPAEEWAVFRAKHILKSANR